MFEGAVLLFVVILACVYWPVTLAIGIIWALVAVVRMSSPEYRKRREEEKRIEEEAYLRRQAIISKLKPKYRLKKDWNLMDLKFEKYYEIPPGVKW